jgi:hypothetical protein
MDTIHKNTKIINPEILDDQLAEFTIGEDKPAQIVHVRRVKPIDPESAEVQLIWLCWHAHQFADMDGRTQQLFWNTAMLALEEMGYDRQELAITMSMYNQRKNKERLARKMSERLEAIA